MLPSDIGAAAAYECWRNWKHHYGVYGQPLAGDQERQREALIGLAVAEGLSLSFSRLSSVEILMDFYLIPFSGASLAIHRSPCRLIRAS